MSWIKKTSILSFKCKEALFAKVSEIRISLQTIVSSIANKSNNKKIKIVLDVEHYRNKRKETLENLAVKVSKTVLKTGKSITLEPMGAYERKIIHTKLQDNKHISTNSIGEEPNRRIVISKI